MVNKETYGNSNLCYELLNIYLHFIPNHISGHSINCGYICREDFWIYEWPQRLVCQIKAIQSALKYSILSFGKIIDFTHPLFWNYMWDSSNNILDLLDSLETKFSWDKKKQYFSALKPWILINFSPEATSWHLNTDMQMYQRMLFFAY